MFPIGTLLHRASFSHDLYCKRTMTKKVCMRQSHLHHGVKQLTTRTHHFVPSVIKKLEKKSPDINKEDCKSFKVILEAQDKH